MGVAVTGQVAQSCDEVATKLALQVGVLLADLPPEAVQSRAHQAGDELLEGGPCLFGEGVMLDQSQPTRDDRPDRLLLLVDELRHEVEEVDRGELAVTDETKRVRHQRVSLDVVEGGHVGEQSSEQVICVRGSVEPVAPAVGDHPFDLALDGDNALVVLESVGYDGATGELELSFYPLGITSLAAEAAMVGQPGEAAA